MATTVILGQGISGSVLAWWLHWQGDRIIIIDRDEPNTASRISAGLLTPITGERFAKDPRFDAWLDAASSFYGRVEAAVSTELFKREPAIRLFREAKEAKFFLEERWSQLNRDVELLTDEHEQPIGFEMPKAARLRVSEFLDVTRSYFRESGRYHSTEIEAAKHIVVEPGHVLIPSLNIQADRIAFCQGYQTAVNPWFPGVPDAANRGEILKVSLVHRTEQRVIHKGCWIAPAESPTSESQTRHFLVGATYDRKRLLCGPTEDGKTQLLRELSRQGENSPVIVEHRAAVRAGTKDREPVAEIHPQFTHVAILNGMGSKASLLAPTYAHDLVEQFSKQRVTSSTRRSRQGKPLTKLAHSIIRRAVFPGDSVIDATAGNGHDTTFLAELTGPGGFVISVDVQRAAVQATKNRVDSAHQTQVLVMLARHEEVLQGLAARGRQFKAIMVNLGYLPGSDKSVITDESSTITVLRAGIRLLCQNGVMTVIGYRGHSGGHQEVTAIERLAVEARVQGIRVDDIESSENPDSPKLFVFRKSSAHR